MKYQILETSLKRISIRLSFSDLRFWGFGLTSLGILAIVLSNIDMSIIANPIANLLSLDPKNVVVVTTIYSSCGISIFIGISSLLKSLSSTTIVFDKNLSEIAINHKSILGDSRTLYPLSDATGVGTIHRKNYTDIVVWLKQGSNYKGKALTLERSVNGSIVQIHDVTQAITDFLSDQPVFIFQDDWIVENEGGLVRIFRNFNEYAIKFILTIDTKNKEFSWQSEEKVGSCSIEEIDEIKLEDDPNDKGEDRSDRIVLIMKNGNTEPISPYHYKYSNGQYTPGLLKLIKQYFNREKR